MRIGKRIQLPSGPPSTIQRLPATGFSVSRGGYMAPVSQSAQSRVRERASAPGPAPPPPAEDQPLAVPIDPIAEPRQRSDVLGRELGPGLEGDGDAVRAGGDARRRSLTASARTAAVAVSGPSRLAD